jgi:hypothetical protein
MRVFREIRKEFGIYYSQTVAIAAGFSEVPKVAPLLEMLQTISDPDGLAKWPDISESQQ